MSKYKIVGLINLLFGLLQLFLPIMLWVSVIPKLTEIYSNFQVNNQPNLTLLFGALILLFIFGLTNIILGVMGFKKIKEKEKIFQYGIMVAVVTFFLMGALVSFLVSSIISHLYNITSQF